MEKRIQTVCLMLLATIAAGAALRWLEPVMIPFVLAVFIALGLKPVIDFGTERLRMPRWLSLLATLVCAGLLFALLVILVTASVAELTNNFPAYEAKFMERMNKAQAALPFGLANINREAVLEPLTKIPAATLGGMLVETTNAILKTLSRSLLVFIFVVYLLLGSSGPRSRSSEVWEEIQQRIKHYLMTKAAVSAATGILVGATLAFLGVDLALVFGLFAFLLNFIPAVGSVISTLLPLPVVLVSPDLSGGAAVAAILIPGGIQILFGNVIEPKVMGESLDLHPIAVLMALIFWGMIWGVVGMLLATPITAVMKILFARLEPTRSISELLAGRIPALDAN